MGQTIWQNIQNETTQNYLLRKPLISEISKFFENKYVISLYTRFRTGGFIDASDFEMLSNLLGGSKSFLKRKILFVVNSPGGDPLVAEKIIKLLSEYSENDYWVLVPDTAKSAATMICFGSNKIILSPISELGPIDLQVPRSNNVLIPAYSIITAYDKLMETGINLKKDQTVDPILHQLQGFDPSEIEYFRQVNELSADIAKKVLKKCMMKKVSATNIAKVINIFLDPTQSKTHGRPIYFSDIEKVDKKGYFKIQCINTIDEIWQQIMEYHLRVITHMRVSNAVKLIESEENSLIASQQTN